MVLALTALAITSCVSHPPVLRRIAVPGSASLGGLHVEAAAADEALILAIGNTTTEEIETVVRVRPLVLGYRTLTDSVLVSYREEIVCEGDVCRPVQVPVYEERITHEPIEGILAVLPRRLTVSPGVTGLVRVKLMNPEDAVDAFSLAVLVYADGSRQWGSLEIECASGLLGLP